MTTLVLTFIISTYFHEQSSLEWLKAWRADSIEIVGKDRIVPPVVPEKEKRFMKGEEMMILLLNDINSTHADAMSLVAKGKRKEAVKSLWRLLVDYPGATYTRKLTFDILAVDREWYRAYVIYAGRDLNRLDGGSDYLRISLASAMLGRVYPGQRDFLVNEITGEAALHDDLLNALPTGQSPKEVALLSLLAIVTSENAASSLGRENVTLYAEMASGYDWGNPIVAFYLGTSYVREGRNLEAEFYLAPAVERATGRLREEIEDLLRRARGG